MADNDQKNQDQNAQQTQSGNESQPAESPEKKSSRKFVIIGVVVLLAIIAGLFYWHSTYYEDTDDAQVDGDLYQVSARVAGQVIKVNVTDNQKVEAGDVIAEIDPRDYQVALEQAEANLSNAKATYLQATANVPITSTEVHTTVGTTGSDITSAQASIAQATKQAAASQARVDQARANATKAQLDVDRYTPLVQRDVISKQQYDQAIADAAATKAALTEAEATVIAQNEAVRIAQQRLSTARFQSSQAVANGPKQVEVQRARAEAANAQIQQAQAQVDQARLNLGYAHITAPTAGIINKKNVAVGQNVSVGQNMLTIIPLDNLWITANFKETQLESIRPNQEVEIDVDALGGRKYKGKVVQIGGATGSRLSLFPPENATGNYVKVVQRIPVRIDLEKDENKDHLLRPGYSVVPKVAVK